MTVCAWVQTSRLREMEKRRFWRLPPLFESGNGLHFSAPVSGPLT